VTQKNKRMSDTNEGGYKQSVSVITGGGEVKLQRLRVDRNLFFGNISKEECHKIKKKGGMSRTNIYVQVLHGYNISRCVLRKDIYCSQWIVA
jgi:hypothetical protein